MIKINLLPPHIHQRKQIKVAVGIVGVLLVAEIAGLLAARTAPQKLKDELTTTLADRDSKLNNVKTVGTEASTVVSGEQALAPKYNFITDMLKYNKAYPDLYQRTAGYTYKEAMFLNLEAFGSQLKFDAYVSDPADVARLMVGLSNSPDFTGLPQVSGVPDYDSAERKKREQDLNSENIPESLVIGGVVGYPGSGGYPGGGYPGGGYPGSGYPSGAPSGEMPSYPGGSSSMSGYPGAEGGSGGTAGTGTLDLLKLEQAKIKPRGFTVTVTCALKNPTTRPSYADSETQLGSSGGGGGSMGGYPGMSSGMSNMPVR
jgi:hypothetical protein